MCDHSPGFPAGVVTTCVKYILSGEISDFCVEPTAHALLLSLKL